MAAAIAVSLLLVAPVVAQDAALESELDRIAKETAEIRGLPPLAEIDDVFVTRDQLLAMMPGMIAEDLDPAEAKAQARALIALGLLPEGTDLYDLTVRLLGEQAAGFYDPRTDEMLVVSEGSDELGGEEYFYSHEVVHALQDANLDPNDKMEEMTGLNGDADLAALAVYEGDAVVTSNAYLEKHPGLALEIVATAATDYPELDAAPGAMAAALLFPYTDGASFIERLRGEGGWDAVNAAYADFPASTEQVLHPAKYLERDAPAEVPLPEASVLGRDWTLVDDDTLGEFQTGLLLANLAPGEGFNEVTGEIAIPEAARNAAAGWDGDRYALWSDDANDVLVWRSVWDTESDARAFSRALAQFEQTRFAGAFNGETPDDVALLTPKIAARIQLDGQEVRYVQAPTLTLADAAIAALQSAPAPDPRPGPD
ncbi:MAG: hypothetical protein U0031_09615 [Thermomicrobiales bacterium]